MAKSKPSEVVRRHFHDFFAGHEREEHVWTLGRNLDDRPQFRIVKFAPGPKTNLWVYATMGAWEACDDPRLEFVIAAPEQDQRHVE